MKYLKILMMMVFLCMPAVLWAQGPGGGDDDLDDPGIPIDGGASILIGAAVMYGVKKLKDKKLEGKEK